jgi:hypothetical protein
LISVWGWRRVGPATDGRQHGEGQHDQRDVAMPTVPGAALVMVEAELVLGGLEGVLDGPALPFNRSQRRDRGSGRAPGGEVGTLAIGDGCARSAGRVSRGRLRQPDTHPRPGRLTRDRPSCKAAVLSCLRLQTSAAKRHAGPPDHPRRHDRRDPDTAIGIQMKRAGHSARFRLTALRNGASGASLGGGTFAAWACRQPGAQ